MPYRRQEENLGIENILSLIGGLAIGDFERITDHTLFLGYQAQFALPESGRKEA